MNAHKFVAEEGIDEAKRVLSGAPDWAIFWISRGQYHGHIISFPNMTGHYSIKLSELKQVVESVEIIDSYNGNEMAKRFIEENVDCSDSVLLEKSIADYELVESYEHVKCEVLDMVDVSPRCEVINETH